MVIIRHSHKTSTSYAEEKAVNEIMFQEHMKKLCEHAERQAERKRLMHKHAIEEAERKKRHSTIFTYTIFSALHPENNEKDIGDWNFSQRYSFN